jgi:hypothetical protein
MPQSLPRWLSNTAPRWKTVRHALADRRAGPLGAALALIDAYQAQHKDSQQTGADF